jgi:inosine-uridine nucleoside N-ribohydrolase
VNAGSGLKPPAALLREVGRHAFTSRAQDRFSLHDPLSAAVAADPDLVGLEEAAVMVDMAGPEVGRTRIVGPGQVRVAVDVDKERALEEFRRTVGLPTSMR